LALNNSCDAPADTAPPVGGCADSVGATTVTCSALGTALSHDGSPLTPVNVHTTNEVDTDGAVLNNRQSAHNQHTMHTFTHTHAPHAHMVQRSTHR
jgi:hypothetical protein